MLKIMESWTWPNYIRGAKSEMAIQWCSLKYNYVLESHPSAKVN